MFHQVGERGVDRLLGKQVGVVQDQEKLLRLPGETIDECLQNGTQWRSLLCLQINDQLRTESGQRSVQSGEHILPEERRLIVSFIQR